MTAPHADRIARALTHLETYRRGELAHNTRRLLATELRLVARHLVGLEDEDEAALTRALTELPPAELRRRLCAETDARTPLAVPLLADVRRVPRTVMHATAMLRGALQQNVVEGRDVERPLGMLEARDTQFVMAWVDECGRRFAYRVTVAAADVPQQDAAAEEG